MTTSPNVLISKVRLEGFRSIKDATVTLGPVNVLIGPNGAGKSNLLTALRLPTIMRQQGLRLFVGEQGGASRLLHYGPEATTECEIDLEFTEGSDRWGYEARLRHAAGDKFVFAKELLSLQSDARNGAVLDLGAGHDEAQMVTAQRPPRTLSKLAELVAGIGYFHFHNTSPTSPLRQNASQADSQSLRWDGSNLAACLYRIRHSEGESDRAAWAFFTGLVRMVAPFIVEIVPDLVAPHKGDASAVRLFWTDERGYRFDAHDLSDGTLRTIALFAALTQPTSARPKFVVLDEPELGLHPAAIALLGGLIRSASAFAQVIVATQSPAMLDQFAPEEVLVTERANAETSFRRLDPKALETWLEEYSLSQLYDKNVLGGRP